MGLAFQAIYPVVYPVAYELFKSGMERHFVAGRIFKQFGARYNIPDRELDTSMIDLSISCAENDYNNKLPQHTSGKMTEDKVLNKLIGTKIEGIQDREYLYEINKDYYNSLQKERMENLELRPELELSEKLRKKLELAVVEQNWRTVKKDGEYSTLPHQYVALQYWKNKNMSFSFFAELIRLYGSVEIWKGNIKNWAGRKGEYLRIGNFKYWTMGYPLEITTVINRENSNYTTHDEYINHPKESI